MMRNQEIKINSLLEMFPAVAIVGARQVGKTTLAKHLRPDWMCIDFDRFSDFERFEGDPDWFFEQHPRHVIFDESQRSHKLFQALRYVVDSNREERGRFILTGSSSPDLLRSVSETLAGRLAIVELGTLRMNEQYQKPLPLGYEMFLGTLVREDVERWKHSSASPDEVQRAWYRGGYPEPWFHSDDYFFLNWMEQYEKTYIERDIATLFPKLNQRAFQRFLKMLCKLSGTILNKAELARALEVSEGSVREFLSIAEGTFLWRSLPSFENNEIKNVVKMPKGYIRDTGLLHSLLRITRSQDLYTDPIVGASFEGFVCETMIKALSSLPLTHWKPFYYRTRGGSEIDLILEGPFGLLPIEIKHGYQVRRQSLRALEDFIQKNDLPFGLLVNQAQHAQWISRHIFQLPIHYL